MRIDQCSRTCARVRMLQDSTARFRQAMIAELDSNLLAERALHSNTVLQLKRELDEVRGLANTYRQSIEAKDGVIAGLRAGLAAEQVRCEAVAESYEQRSAELEREREQFKLAKADRHYADTLQRRCFRAIHGIIQARWKVGRPPCGTRLSV